MNHSRFDLKVLLASIVAACAVIGVVLTYEQTVQSRETLERATEAARLVRVLPFSELSEERRQDAYSKLLHHLSNSRRFAYAQVDDGEGKLLSSEVALGVKLPNAPASHGAISGWVERLELDNLDGRKAFELHGPLAGESFSGHYRIAFFKPSLWEFGSSVSYFASMIFPIFMLVPLLLLLLRREIRPIKRLALSISGGKSAGQLDSLGASAASGDITEFADQFNSFVDQAQSRIDTYQEERDRLVTSERFLNYRLVKLEAILHALNSGIAIIDSKGTTTFCNDMFCHYLGQEASELVGKSPSLWPISEEFSVFRELGTESDRTGGPGKDLVPSQLSGVTLRATAHLVRTSNTAKNTGRVLVLQDVSGESLANKSRGEFVGHVAHELKTPLNTLSLCVQSLQGPDGDDPAHRNETLNVLHDEIERLSLLIGNLLSITQLEMGTMSLQTTRVKLSDLLNDAVSSVGRSTAANGLRFSVDVEADVDTIQVDKPLFRTALNNLLTNAVKYSNAQGVISVTASQNGRSLEISVADEGIGIPEGEQELIFEKFSRGSSKEVYERSGHGLGLSLTKDIVDLHHGTLRVQSEVGKGSRFTIELGLETGALRKTL